VHWLRSLRSSLPVGRHFSSRRLRIPTKPAILQVTLCSTYEINMLRCIFCGFCEDACPTEAIVLEDKYELSFVDRAKSIYTKEMLIDPVPAGGQPTHKRRRPGIRPVSTGDESPVD